MTEAANEYVPYPSFRAWAEKSPELSMWEQTLASLQSERAAASEEAASTSARMIARAAAVDTSAIEGFYDVDRGFTISVARQTANWEVAFAEKGAQARSMFEAQLRAFDLVLDVATNRLPVTEALIRSIHEHTCAAQKTYKVWTEVGWQEQELPLGKYKQHPNNPRTADGRLHPYAPVDVVSPEMSRLVDEFRTDRFATAAAPLQAAYAHYALVAVHPFADGNGRVARALASIYLVRATSVPLLIFADQKPRYLDALAEADAGNYEAFSAFVRERSIDAMRFLIAGIRKAEVTPPDELARETRRLHYATPTMKHGEVDAVAKRLLDHAKETLESTFERLSLPEEISLTTEIREGESSSIQPGYRKLVQPDRPRLKVLVQSTQPATAAASSVIIPLVARAEDHPSPIRLRESNRGLHLDARIEDLTPEISSFVQLQLETWIETLVSTLVEQVIAAGEKSLESSGWRG